MSIINKFYLTKPFDVIETCVVKEPTREQRQPVSSVLLESKRDLVNFHRPKGIGTIEEVGVISFEPRSPSKISRLDSLLPSDSFLYPFRPLSPAHLQLLAVRLMRSEPHSRMRWQANPIDVDESMILGLFVPPSVSVDSDDEGPRRRQLRKH